MKFRFTAVLLVVAPILLYFLFIISYGINFPQLDDYDVFFKFLLDYNHTNSLVGKIALLFHQHFEHRVFTAKLPALIEYLLTGKINFIVLNLVANLGLVAIFWVLSRHISDAGLKNLIYLAPLSLLIFNLEYYELGLWATASLNNIGVAAFAMLSIYFFFRESWAALIASLVFAFLATFSMGNGIAVFPAVFGVLLLNNRLFTLKSLVWTLTFVICYKTYFYHYTFMHKLQPAEFTNPGNLKAIIYFSLVFMGRWLSYNVHVALAAGILLALLFLFITLKRFYKTSAALYAYTLFILATIFMTALGRYHSGIHPAISGIRYSFFPVLFVAVFYTIMMINYANRLRSATIAGICVSCLAFNIAMLAAYIHLPNEDKIIFDQRSAAATSGIISNFDFGWLQGNKEIPQQFLKSADSLHIFQYKFTDQRPLLATIPYSDSIDMQYEINSFDDASTTKVITGWFKFDNEKIEDLSFFISILDSNGKEVEFLVPYLPDAGRIKNLRTDTFFCEFTVPDLKPGSYKVELVATNSKFKVARQLQRHLTV